MNNSLADSIFDPEIYNVLTPKARELIKDIELALSAVEIEKEEIRDLSWESTYRIFTTQEEQYKIIDLLINNIRNNFDIVTNVLNEYKYSLFTQRINEALDKMPFLNGAVKITVSPKPIRDPISISLNRNLVFGTIDNYIAAAKQVSRSKSTPEVRSRRWKILYIKAREQPELTLAAHTYKKKKRRGNPNKKRSSNMLAIYKNIITRRLEKHTKAGFWYLIEYGNVGIRGVEGSPYPLYQGPPYPFLKYSVQQAEKEVNNLFLKIYNEYRLANEEKKPEEFKKQIEDFLSMMSDGFAKNDINLIKTSIRVGEDIKRRLVLTKSKRFGIRIGVRKI